MHFGISEGKGGGGVKTWKLSVVGYGYFLELPNEDNCCQLQGIGKLIKEKLSKGIFKVD